MGGTTYSSDNRSIRSASLGYATKSRDDIFTQSRSRRVHKEMDPKGVLIRESRDSEAHPRSIPIIVGLDETGSMGNIPHDLIKDGLPRLMSGLIQNGIPDPQVLFLGIGDHECDDAPLQVSQFESGDEELDMWLTRVYLEGRGGGNGGESYSLAHYFAANHTVTDHWEKRGQKGFLFTIGDEPNLRKYPARAMEEIMGNGDIAGFTDIEILEKAQEKWNVYHIMPGKETSGARAYWKEMLDDKLIWVDHFSDIADAIKNIVVKNTPSYDAVYQTVTDEPTVQVNVTPGVDKPNIML